MAKTLSRLKMYAGFNEARRYLHSLATALSAAVTPASE